MDKSLEEKIFTTEELAEYWKVSYNTINILLRRGELQGFRVMRAWRIPLSAVKKYEEERTPKPSEIKTKREDCNMMIHESIGGDANG